MLSALIKRQYLPQVWWSLKSRGWIDWDSNITPQGVAYLIKRGYNTDLNGS
jgi:hypothetical protein